MCSWVCSPLRGFLKTNRTLRLSRLSWAVWDNILFINMNVPTCTKQLWPKTSTKTWAHGRLRQNYHQSIRLLLWICSRWLPNSYEYQLTCHSLFYMFENRDSKTTCDCKEKDSISWPLSLAATSPGSYLVPCTTVHLSSQPRPTHVLTSTVAGTADPNVRMRTKFIIWPLAVWYE